MFRLARFLDDVTIKWPADGGGTRLTVAIDACIVWGRGQEGMVRQRNACNGVEFGNRLNGGSENQAIVCENMCAVTRYRNSLEPRPIPPFYGGMGLGFETNIGRN